jgi:hypothetical protein
MDADGADRNVLPTIDEIMRPKRKVAEGQGNLDCRLGNRKIDQRIAELHQAEGFRRGDTQRADRHAAPLRQVALGCFHIIEHPLAGLQIDRAFLGEVQAAGRPVEQGDAQPLFKVGDVARHQGARDAKLAGSTGETLGMPGANEGFHHRKAIHRNPC